MITYRAIVNPKAWATDQEFMGDRPSMQVVERDDTPVSTGLVDIHGVTIYRCEPRAPMGFKRA